MTGPELILKYGNLVAGRIVRELTFSEMAQVVLEDLSEYLDIRADVAHKKYQDAIRSDRGSDLQVGQLRSEWQVAEDLSYLVLIADSVAETTASRLTAVAS